LNLSLAGGVSPHPRQCGPRGHPGSRLSWHVHVKINVNQKLNGVSPRYQAQITRACLCPFHHPLSVLAVYRLSVHHVWKFSRGYSRGASSVIRNGRTAEHAELWPKTEGTGPVRLTRIECHSREKSHLGFCFTEEKTAVGADRAQGH
jgi:hypothetical protein